MRLLTLLQILSLATGTFGTAPTNVNEDEINRLFSAGKCREARLRIQNAQNRDQFLSTPQGKAYYAASLCFSSPQQLDGSDINNALAHTEAALAQLRNGNPDFVQWIKLVVQNQCHRAQQQLARNQTEKRFAAYSGKIGSHCTANASPSLIEYRPGSEALPWTPIVSLPSATARIGVSTLSVPEELLARAKREHVGQPPQVAECSPFLALSASEDPQSICKAASDFYAYFLKTYSADPPSGWIVIQHYDNAADIQAHAKERGGPACPGLFGYFDWRYQTIAFRAQPGLFGTLQHELTHALVFWDLPLAPRWFEEGLAALYENTDRAYQGLQNPWRQQILEHVPDPEATFFHNVLSLGPLEFEENPEWSTICRALLMRMQKQGDLPGLYKELHHDPDHLCFRVNPEAPLASFPQPITESWEALVRRHLVRPQ
jgi:hypothetical protein